MNNIVCGYRDVLYTCAFIKVKVFFNLRFFLSLSRLVDWKFVVAISIRYYFRHEGTVFGRDVFVIKRNQQTESHYLFIKIYPRIHFTQFHIAYAMIDILQSNRFNVNATGTWFISEKERTAILFALYKRMNGFAIGFNGRYGNFP